MHSSSLICSKQVVRRSKTTHRLRLCVLARHGKQLSLWLSVVNENRLQVARVCIWRHAVVRYGAAWYDTVCHVTVLYGAIFYGTVVCRTVLYGTV